METDTLVSGRTISNMEVESGTALKNRLKGKANGKTANDTVG